MKKFLLLFSILIPAAMLSAQAWSEDFDPDTELPAGWSVIDGTTSEPNRGPWYVSEGSGVGDSNSVYLDTYQADFGAPSDYLITPLFEVMDGYELSFAYKGGYPPDYSDYVSVYASKTGVSEGDFTITVVADLEVANDVDYLIHKVVLSENESISAGDNIYIAFYSESNGSGIDLDNISYDAPTALFNHKAQLNTISVYPNPSSDAISIKGVNAADKVIITNIVGQKVYESKYVKNDQIDISSFSKGLYFVSLTSKNEVVAIDNFIVK